MTPFSDYKIEILAYFIYGIVALYTWHTPPLLPSTASNPQVAVCKFEN
ncbi:hypothetical protein HanIR_Chr10g0476511 [Helianthus annuus]|nr:hypothetical protein HanIR_Chr10g0476511 [Helianthus annuus]